MVRAFFSRHRRLLVLLALALSLLLAVHVCPAGAEDEGASGGSSGSKPKGRAVSPFWPPTKHDVAGIVLIGLGLLIAAGGGIDGGGKCEVCCVSLVGIGRGLFCLSSNFERCAQRAFTFTTFHVLR